MTDLPPEDRGADRSRRRQPNALPDRRPRDWRAREAAARFPGVVLDPSEDADAGDDVHPTLYVPDTLLITPPDGVEAGDIVGRLDALASSFGWTVAEEPLRAPDRRTDAAPALPSAARSAIARISVAPDANPERPAVDAWRLLRAARRAGLLGVALEHVMAIDALQSNPFTGNPFTGNPFTGNPFTGNPFTGNPFTGNPFTGNGGTAAYGIPGFGGRQPVVYTGPAPTAGEVADGGRRPVVAILDTGCGAHAWLGVDVVIDPVSRFGASLGIVDPTTDPEAIPSLGDPLDGVIDRASGHGTFIAGVVVQACPDALVLPVRVADSQGVILERDLTSALGQLVTLAEKGEALDVVNLSFSYFHESPDDAADDGELYSLLIRLRRRGCTVVCSAGNDSTDRPASPASLYAYPGGPIPASAEEGLAPHVVVGALNPSGSSVAMFSNIGDWVRVYALGVSVLSTVPSTLDAGVQADLRHDLYGRRRETLDMDDLRSGFAVWSGTSFAAPLVAGRIAAELAPGLLAGQTAAPAVPDAQAAAAAVVTDLDAHDRSRSADDPGAAS